MRDQSKRHVGGRAYSCQTCGETFTTAQGVRGHQNRHRNPNLSPEPVEPRFDLRHPNLGEPISDEIEAARERLELRKIEEELRAIDARAERREREELAELLRVADQARQDRMDREAAERHAEEARRAAQAEERRRQQAREARIDQGKKLADRLLEANNVDVFARWRIRTEVQTALEKAADNEQIEHVVSRVLAGQLPPPKTTESARAPATPLNQPQPVLYTVEDDPEGDETDDEREDELDDDEYCEECAAENAGGSGWGLLLVLGGIATLAALKYPADKRTAAPPGEPPAPKN
jgi:hypothetical protein